MLLRDINCLMGYACNIVRSRTCGDEECILNKSQVRELDRKLAIFNVNDQEVEDSRNQFHLAGEGLESVSIGQ